MKSTQENEEDETLEKRKEHLSYLRKLAKKLKVGSQPGETHHLKPIIEP